MSSTKTIGIIGGGQLGQMMAISAIYMGHKVITLDPASDCPSSRVSEVIAAPYDDVDALKIMSSRLQQVVTMATVKKSSHQPKIWKRQMHLLTQLSVSWKSSSTSTLKFRLSCLVTARM